METKHKLIHPEHLETGKSYVLRELLPHGRKIAWMPVHFICYTTCPGIAIVADGAGKKMRVLRSELFCSFSQPDIAGISHQPAKKELTCNLHPA